MNHIRLLAIVSLIATINCSYGMENVEHMENNGDLEVISQCWNLIKESTTKSSAIGFVSEKFTQTLYIYNEKLSLLNLTVLADQQSTDAAYAIVQKYSEEKTYLSTIELLKITLENNKNTATLPDGKLTLATKGSLTTIKYIKNGFDAIHFTPTNIDDNTKSANLLVPLKEQKSTKLVPLIIDTKNRANDGAYMVLFDQQPEQNRLHLPRLLRKLFNGKK